MSRELVLRVTMKDCVMQTFRVGGAGGQHRDKTSAGVRIVHPASGASGQASEDRHQVRNKRVAFRRMAESLRFQSWARAIAAGWRPVDEVVDEVIERNPRLVAEYLAAWPAVDLDEWADRFIGTHDFTNR